MKPTIMFLAPADSIHSYRWIKFFHDQGYSVSWASFCEPAPFASELAKSVKFLRIYPSQVNIHDRFKSLLYLTDAVLKLRKFIKEQTPYLLHVHSVGSYGLVGRLAFFKQTIMTPWGSDILLESVFKKYLTKWILKGANMYTCDGINTEDVLVKFGCSRSLIHRIMFGTDTDFFSPLEKKNQNEERTINIISLRQFEPIYDIKTLIYAMHMLITKNIHAHLRLVGDGSDRMILENLIEKLGIQDHVDIIGRKSQIEIRDLLRNSDIYVSTSLSDSGLAASTAEAMSVGLPVVVSDSGDNKKWIEENTGGHIVMCGDVEDFADKIKCLVDDKDKRLLYGSHNRAIILEKNNYKKEMKKMCKLYGEFSIT